METPHFICVPAPAQGPHGAAPSPALDARPGCQGLRSACCQGIRFLTTGTGKPWNGSPFLFSPGFLGS